MTGDGEWKLIGRIVTSGQDLGRGWLRVSGATVTGIGAGEGPPCASVINVEDRVVAPGFVDLHVHGAGGYQFGGASREEAVSAAREVAVLHAAHGTTTMLATTVSDGPEQLRMIVSALADLVGAASPGGACIGGIHLEGPWLAPTRAGAHRPDLLRRPDAEELSGLVTASRGTIRMVTYAPELDQGQSLLKAGLTAGIVMSVGHTEADRDTVVDAFAAGARHVTHLGNAMPPLDRRAPGPLGAALETAGVTLEVIADGFHLHPGFLSLVAQVAGDRLVAVTDAVAACGMPDGRYRLGDQDIVIRSNRVSLASDPGVLAGSGLTMDRAVATLVSVGLPLDSAISAATAAPAACAGMASKGHLRLGSDADIVVLGHDLRAVATVVQGEVAWDPDGLLAPAQREPLSRSTCPPE